MHLRYVEISVEISDETSFFLEKIKNLGQNLGHFGPKISKTLVRAGGRLLTRESKEVLKMCFISEVVNPILIKERIQIFFSLCKNCNTELK